MRTCVRGASCTWVGFFGGGGALQAEGNRCTVVLCNSAAGVAGVALTWQGPRMVEATSLQITCYYIFTLSYYLTYLIIRYPPRVHHSPGLAHHDARRIAQTSATHMSRCTPPLPPTQPT